MHVVFRESHGLEETEVPRDLGQSPADMVVLSFSDSDLGAFAAAWHGAAGQLPGLRLANIAALTHPVSVDTYVEATLSGAKAILVRLIGGTAYWPYGLQQIEALARRNGIALAVLPADGRPDPRLDAASTLPAPVLARLAALCDSGGADAALTALGVLAKAAGLPVADTDAAPPLPEQGFWTPEAGVMSDAQPDDSQPLILILFYRSYLLAGDLDPIAALIRSFHTRGFRAVTMFVPSLKHAAAAWVAGQVAYLRPAAIVNATAFSARGEMGASPLDSAGVPAFQVALATSDRQAWCASDRGLSPADLAMHVVMPEVDGRIFAGVASFKSAAARDADLEFARVMHLSDPERIAAIADRVAGWHRLAATSAPQRRVAVVLSSYPGREWNMAHAVGLDALASAEAILQDLAQAGHDIPPDSELTSLAKARIHWPMADYLTALSRLPETLRDALAASWGDAKDDPDATPAGFAFAALRRGKAIIALQPERGQPGQRAAEYHDLSRVPRHGYVAFYLWLRQQADALVHVGAHGTLEWLPGKSVALGPDCWPEALIRDLPVIYPFIVNDPGEAAQAKRRIGAVTLGHVPPPQQVSGTPHRLARLEALLDEFSNADGLDPKRRDRLTGDILDEAARAGLDIAGDASSIPDIDRFVCDVKDSQFGDGLHVWGRAPDRSDDLTRTCAKAERQSLLDALAGRRIEPGPAGSPWRGRRDVLPTGRNLYTTDPRSLPSRAAYAQGGLLADELVRRHLQDHGDWPRGIILDLWGSATMRTAGEEFAMALVLLGVRPIWDAGSERVSGIEILPIAELDRPRLDVTLRISGLFRDLFPTLTALFQQAVRALAARDESPDWNPYSGQDLARVFAPAPGSFGLGMGEFLGDYSETGRRKAGEAWLAASSWAVDGDRVTHDPKGIAMRVRSADAFVHVQDLPETDLLLAEDYAAHEAGVAAAMSVTGGKAALLHLDATDPTRPRARSLPEEIARVTHARAAHPGWIAGMRRHGFRGAAEIAATLENMAAFAHLAGVVPSALFDLYWDATLGDGAVAGFLRDANPQAFDAMQQRFAELHAAGLWLTRRNSILATMEGRP
ncbi:cobaltochelatase subunit CobN [Paracoccus sp. PAR01]|uniref:cobaltochelatase subunit CobN n=1 Tax=Paracoccus sp. PAR01 TaxID=2769282 RepID=UPI00177C9F88|nr:cobaltochelatase subunit CobN [Paracoccus sp. PAR01]MBD9529368.1 cobaltochelatase subunit CobN [Paracoccus sp. PAR01]